MEGAVGRGGQNSQFRASVEGGRPAVSSRVETLTSNVRDVDAVVRMAVPVTTAVQVYSSCIATALESLKTGNVKSFGM